MGIVKKILIDLTEKIIEIDTQVWLGEIGSWKKQYVKTRATNLKVNPQYALELLSDLIEDDAIISADVGQNQIWTSHYLDMTYNRIFLTSGGLGTMGYSIPASVGCKLAFPDRRVVAVLGDEIFQMSMPELGTSTRKHCRLQMIMKFLCMNLIYLS